MNSRSHGGRPERVNSPSFRSPKPPSRNQINRTGPGLISVGLRHTQVDWQGRAAGETDAVVERNAAAPVSLGQAVDAELPAKSAAFERDRVVGERRKVDDAGDDVGLDLERAAR